MINSNGFDASRDQDEVGGVLEVLHDQTADHRTQLLVVRAKMKQKKNSDIYKWLFNIANNFYCKKM